jgi:hypothetical protein
VILHAVVVAMGTVLLMATQRLGPTAPDGLGGLELRERKSALFGEFIEILHKYVL